jgi:hypothetical protein
MLEYNQQAAYPAGGWGTASRLYELRYTVATAPIINLSTSAINATTDSAEVPAAGMFAISNVGIGTLNYVLSTQYSDPSDPAWLQATPGSGSSTGPGDTQTITVTYLAAVAGLPVGTHTATITVSDPVAQNAPATVTVVLTVRTVLPDVDKDGDVDQSDFGQIQACCAQSGQPPTSGCVFADFNHDNTVNAADLAVFSGCLSGPGAVAGETCDDAFQ